MFEVLEAEVKDINSNKDTLKRNLLDLIELQYILMQTQSFFEEVCSSVQSNLLMLTFCFTISLIRLNNTAP